MTLIQIAIPDCCHQGESLRGTIIDDEAPRFGSLTDTTVPDWSSTGGRYGMTEVRKPPDPAMLPSVP